MVMCESILSFIMPEINEMYFGQELLDMGFKPNGYLSGMYGFSREEDRSCLYVFTDSLEFDPKKSYVVYRLVQAR
jgi:hypothetical protein